MLFILLLILLQIDSSLKQDIAEKVAVCSKTQKQREAIASLSPSIQSLKTLAQSLHAQTNKKVFPQIANELDKRCMGIETELVVGVSY